MNREQIQRDIVIALDFAMQIIDNPSIFADEAAITFPDDENVKLPKT